ncbi:PAS domain-containing sensor histidine kinase [Tunicatimonas pelagia]|uniref:PAS domain-containing sensor histidine kinase n=1 Tax=Tunicatimonas pelagia TaxID=931531 RepID=UPI00266577E8|nr:ATP-binding protein [Tunicatimonas pelagia]WKN44368.1 ATP-binding protein [Tunicatimonas pelagia]
MNETLFSDIFEAIENGVLIFSPVHNQQGKITDLKYEQVNQLALQTIKRRKQDLIGSTLLTAFPTLAGSKLFEQYVRVLESGDSFRSEFHYQGEGLDTWFRNHVFRLGTNLVVQFTDIGEYRQLLKESARNESLYKALIQALPDLDLLLVDRNLRVQFSKGRPLKAFGSVSVIELDTELSEKLDPAALDEIKDNCKKNFKQETVRREVTHDDAIYRVSFVPVHDHTGEVFGSLIVTEDIGVFSLSEDELRNKLYALESTQESLEQFAYVASHDLQEPLRKIRAFGDRITTRYANQLDDTGQDYFARMQNAAQRMQVLIDDLLKYSRVGRIQNGFEPVDLNDLVSAVLNDMETAIGEAEAIIEVENLPTIEGEATQLRQLFQNLLSNAIKFKKEGTAPHIKITSGKLSETLAGAYSKLNNPREIIVQDNGIGFEEKYLDRIFNIFQRLHGRNHYPGTGIGLAICRKIIDNHQGDIFATSEVGEGASFHMILPQQQNTQL